MNWWLNRILDRLIDNSFILNIEWTLKNIIMLQRWMKITLVCVSHTEKTLLKSINQSFHQSITMSKHYCFNESIHQFIRPSIHKSIHASNYPSINVFIYSSVNPWISHQSIHKFFSSPINISSILLSHQFITQ